MTEYLVRRLLSVIPMVLGISVLLFGLMNLAPGGPETMLLGGQMGGGDIDPIVAKELRQRLGLDQPLHIQYLRWLSRVSRGDLGNSFFKKVPVWTLIGERLAPTIALTGLALAVSVLVSVPLGIVSAVRRYSVADFVATSIALLGLSVPSFWLGIVLILVFAVWLGWFPISGTAPYGRDDIVIRLHYLVLPTFALTAAKVGIFTRFMRSSMIDVLSQDYVRTARAKGLRENSLLYHHALRNALIPVITVVGLQLPSLIGGAAVIESVFAYAGIGLLAVESTRLRDYPVIMGISIGVAVVVILSNLVVDFVYAMIDPRIRYN